MNILQMLVSNSVMDLVIRRLEDNLNYLSNPITYKINEALLNELIFILTLDDYVLIKDLKNNGVKRSK